MVRYNPYGSRIAQPEMIDTGDVPYISYQSENFLPMVSQGMGEMQKRYDIAQSAMAKYLEENAALKARGADYQNVMNRLDEELANIKSTVKDTYGGDYGAAVNEVVKRLGKARGIYHQAQQEYERALPYEQEMAKLQREGKLLFTPDAQGNIVDPRTQVAFDERGNYTPVDYNRFREQSDYVKEAQPLVEKVNKLIKENPTWRSKYGYLGAVTLQGLNALDEKDLDELIESYAPIFEKDTTYGIDPKYKDLSSKDFLKNTVKSLASSGEKTDWMKDWISEQNRELGLKTQPAEVDPWFSLGEVNKENKEYTENALGIDRGHFINGKYVGTFPKEGELSYTRAKVGEEPMSVMPNKLVQDSLDKFRKKYNLTQENDEQVWDLMNTVENRLNQDFGTIWTVPESASFSMRPLTQNIFINDKGEFGDFANRRIWVNGTEVTDKDKVGALKKKLGTDEKGLKEKLNQIGTANITFTGNTPAGIVGYTNDSKGKQVRLEVSNYDQVAKPAKDMHTIATNLRKGDNSIFTLSNKVVFRDETGKSYTAEKAAVDVDIVADRTGKKQAVPVLKLYDANGKLLQETTELGYFGTIARNQLTPYIKLKP